MGRAVAVAGSSCPRRPNGAAGPRMVQAAAEFAPVIEQCLRNGGRVAFFYSNADLEF